MRYVYDDASVICSDTKITTLPFIPDASTANFCVNAVSSNKQNIIYQQISRESERKIF